MGWRREERGKGRLESEKNEVRTSGRKEGDDNCIFLLF